MSDIIKQLSEVLIERKTADADSSYVASLYAACLLYTSPSPRD